MIQQRVNLFSLDEQQFAIPINSIARVVRAVEVTPVPHAPAYILGVIDYHGSIIPVMNIRHCLGLPAKEVDIDDRIIILDSVERRFAIVVDSISDIISVDDKNTVATDEILHEPELQRMVRMENGIVFIYDIEQLLKHDEEQLLDKIVNEKYAKVK